MSKRQESQEVETIFEETEETTTPSGGSLAIPDDHALSVHQINPDLVLHAGDRPINWVKLGQATSAQGTPGKFFFQETNEEVDELYLIPATIQANRSLWPEGGFSRGRRPDCASEDGVYAVTHFPTGEIPLFPGAPCSQCQYFVPKPWMAPPGTRICQAGYVVTGFSVATLEMVGMRLSGTATKVARVMARPGVFQQRPVRLYAEKKTSDSGSWFQLLATVADPLTPEQMESIKSLLTGEGLLSA
jgi:hypothetical protein